MLSLLDQVYDMRDRMRSLMRAIEAQPEDTRGCDQGVSCATS